MCLTLLQNEELTEGRTQHPALGRFTLPLQRVIRARHDLNLLEIDREELTFRRLIPKLNPFLASLNLRSIPPQTDCLWPELERECASAMIRTHLQFGRAYGQQLRDEQSVNILADRLLDSGICFYSNYAAPINEDGSVAMELEGESITDYTFEFAIIALQHATLTLFLSLDED